MLQKTLLHLNTGIQAHSLKQIKNEDLFTFHSFNVNWTDGNINYVHFTQL